MPLLTPFNITMSPLDVLPDGRTWTLVGIIDWSAVPVSGDQQPAPVALAVNLTGPSSIAFQIPQKLTIEVDNTQCASGLYIYAANTLQGLYVGARRRKRVTLIGAFTQGLLVLAASTVTLGKTSVVFSTLEESTWDDLIPADLTGSNGFNPANTTSAKIVTLSVPLSSGQVQPISLVPGYSIAGVSMQVLALVTGAGGCDITADIIGSLNVAPLIQARLAIAGAEPAPGISQALMPWVPLDGLAVAGLPQVMILGPSFATSGTLAVTVRLI